MVIRNVVILVFVVVAGMFSGCTSSRDQKRTNDEQISAALELSRQNKYAEAAEILKKVISSDPQSFEAYSNLGSMYVRMTKLSEALDAFEKAKKIRPGASVSYYNIGGAYLSAGEYDNAKEAFIEFNNKFPQESDGYLGLSLVAMERKQYADAIRILEETDKKHPNTLPIMYSLAVCYSMTGEDKKAEDYKTRVSKVDARILPQLEGSIKLAKEKK
jgi:tetratricopeptide (TPR) repeat protein